MRATRVGTQAGKWRGRSKTVRKESQLKDVMLDLMVPTDYGWILCKF